MGGTSGAPFDDAIGGTTHMTITYSPSLLWSVKFGDNPTHGSKGPEVAEIRLGCDERLGQVKGTTSPKEAAHPIVTSLTFVTNKNTYGPYGAASSFVGEHFESSPDGKVVGFLGRSGTHVVALGTYTYLAASATE